MEEQKQDYGLVKAHGIDTVLVVGAGIMGQGVAQNFAQAQKRVYLVDISEQALERSEGQIRRNLSAFEAHGLLEEAVGNIHQRITYHALDDLEELFMSCQFLVEAMPELLELKQGLFERLDALNPEAIIASNTSSLTISTLGENMTSAQRLIGVHYFNPAHIIPAVEIHKGAVTSASVIERTLAFLASVGKQPVLVRKEVPGFIINRLTGAMEREIDFLLDNGVVSPEDLDKAVKASYGFRLVCLGPMEAEDMIGLDTAARVSGNLFPTLSNADKPSEQLLAKIEKNELGLKSGKGWYDYPDGNGASAIDRNNERLLKQLKLFNQQQKLT